MLRWNARLGGHSFTEHGPRSVSDISTPGLGFASSASTALLDPSINATSTLRRTLDISPR
jgi:hypothetical protein